MARNMCFDRDADEIADTLNGENGIELGDVLSGVIGLARIVARLDASIRVTQKDLKRIAEEHRGEIVTNTGKIELLAEKSIAQGEALRVISQLFNNISKEGK